MKYYPRTVAAIAAASMLAAFAAQADKGPDSNRRSEHHNKESHKDFFVTGGATYLEPSLNGLDYTNTMIENPIPSTPILYTEDVQPGFNWGYFLQAGYRISHHYDVEASWAQFNSSLSDSYTAVGKAGQDTTQHTSNGASFVDLTAGQTATAESSQNINYSVFDANIGQYHDITEMLRTRVFAGINYARVNADTDNVYTQSSSALVRYENYDSTFNGWGPEVGLDLEYEVVNHFGVVSHLGASFLIGQLDASSLVYDQDGARQVGTDAESVVRMVPALNAKLGVNWNAPYELYNAVSFGVEAGYQVAYYWDVVDQIQVQNFTDTATLKHNFENYGNMGPYLNFTAMF